jgi:hypothetical protein
MRLTDLVGLQLEVVNALIDAPLAWQSAPELARRAGIELDPTADTLADLEADGWVESWPDPPVGPYPWPAPVVTFTPIAAAELGIRIVEVGPEETPRWARADAPEPPAPKARGIFRDFGSLGLVEDPAPGPEDLAIEAEEAAAQKPRRRRRRELPSGAIAEARRAELARRRRKDRLNQRLAKKA